MTRRVFDGEIAHEIAGEDDARYERLRAVARSLLDVVRDGLLRDGEVRIHGFGTFRLQRSAPRTGRNPRTGEPVEIPARNRVLFRPAKALRERIEPHRAATVLAEPQPSREATLAARGPVRSVPEPSVSPSRASAERVALEGDGARASREASLGSAVPQMSRSVATVPAVPPRADRQPVYAHAVSTAPTAGSGASREATLALGGGRETGAGGLPGEEKADWIVEGETDMPRHRMARVTAGDGPLNESEPGGAGPSGQAGDRGPVRAEHEHQRRRGGFWAALVLVLLLLGVAIWLLWPASEPAPRLAEQGGAPAGEEGASADRASEQEASSADGGEASSDGATADAGGATQAGEAAEASDSADTGDTAAASDAATGAGDDTAAAGEGTGDTAAAASGESDQTAASGDAAAAGEAAGAGDAGAEGGAGAGDTTPASGSEDTASSAAASGGDDRGDAAAGAEQAAATGAQAGEAGGAAQAPSEARPLHGMAAAGSTRAPRSDMSSQQASAADAGDGTMPTSAQDIENAGAQPAGDGGASEGSVTGDAFFEGREYTVEPGDTLWGLAERNYVNPFFWPHIWNNNDDLANPDRISVDQLLWLPTLEGEPTNLTEADRRSIAQGYLQLYRFFKKTGDANPGYALVGVRFFDPSVLPERLRGSAAVKPSTALAATFKARLESRFETR